MGRPPLARGTYGAISCHQVGPSKYKARARYRDLDGTTRTVAKFGQTKGAAERALRLALRDRQQSSGAVITADTRVGALAQLWLTDVRASGRAAKTKEHYAYAVERYVGPYFGDLRVGELDAGVADRGLKRITAAHGPSAAKTARAVLSGVLGVAVLNSALTTNPVREASPISVRRNPSRSLTAEQETAVSSKMREQDTPAGARAIGWDLPDLVDWMLATGCRIGEALAIREGVNAEGEPLLDLDAGTWEVDATAVRIKGEGMLLQLRPKSEAGWRRIALPSYAVDLMRRRQAQFRLHPAGLKLLHRDGTISSAPETWLAFPAPKVRAMRDPSNTQGDLRTVLDELDHPADCARCDGGLVALDDRTREPLRTARGGLVRCDAGPWSWVTSHTFRRTVITRLLRAGIDPVMVADHVGHDEPSMTLNVYGGRQVVAADAARILDRG